MSQQGSFTIGSGLRLVVVVIAAVIAAALHTPAALITACAVGLGALCLRPAPVQPEAAQPETAQPETAQPETAQPETAQPETAQPETRAGEVNPFQQIELEALRDRVGALEEALDQARNDMVSLSDIADSVPPQSAGAAVSRIAQLTGLLQQEIAPTPLGDVLATHLAEGPAGWWTLESELPTLRSLPALVGELMKALVETTEGAVGQVRCAGSTRAGMGVVEVSFVASQPLEQVIGFHVANRSAELLGGRLWTRRVGAEDRVLVALPLDYFPSLRMATEPEISFGLL